MPTPAFSCRAVSRCWEACPGRCDCRQTSILITATPLPLLWISHSHQDRGNSRADQILTCCVQVGVRATALSYDSLHCNSRSLPLTIRQHRESAKRSIFDSEAKCLSEMQSCFTQAAKRGSWRSRSLRRIGTLPVSRLVRGPAFYNRMLPRIMLELVRS